MRSGSSEAGKWLVRPAAEGDLADLRYLWQACFGDSDAFTDYYFEDYVGHNEVLVISEGGHVRSMLHLNPYSFSVRGCEGVLCYIVGVATDPAYRHQGMMAALLKKAFHVMAAKGMPMTYLMPADPSIYRSFGFEYIYSRQLVRSEGKPEGAAPDWIMGRVSEEDLPALSGRVNDVLSRTYDMFTLRDPAYYRRLMRENQADGGDLCFLYQGDRCVGHFSYALEDHLEVREYLAESDAAFLHWLGAAFGGVRREVLPLLPIKEAVPYEKEFQPIIMGRILDLPSLVRMAGPGGEDFSVRIRVSDPLIAGNDGLWLWTCRQGQVIFERTQGVADIVTDAGGFWQYLTAYSALKKLLINEIV
jgi:predicted acetyltransferase